MANNVEIDKREVKNIEPGGRTEKHSWGVVRRKGRKKKRPTPKGWAGQVLLWAEERPARVAENEAKMGGGKRAKQPCRGDGTKRTIRPPKATPGHSLRPPRAE